MVLSIFANSFVVSSVGETKAKIDRLSAKQNGQPARSESTTKYSTNKIKRNTNAMNINTVSQLEEALKHHTGTSSYYMTITDMIYTRGVLEMAELAGAYWLIDKIAVHAATVAIHEQLSEFAIVRLETKDDESAIFSIIPDSNQPPVISEEIDYTDFPKGAFEMYLINNVLLLKSEY